MRELGEDEGQEALPFAGRHDGGDALQVGAGGVLADGFETEEFGLRGGFFGDGGGGEGFAGGDHEFAVFHADGEVVVVEFFDGGGLGGREMELVAYPGDFVVHHDDGG